ncbi:TonB-dependent receptor plug domain-containing protein [Mucilaginibacter gynuensis]|uniref:TonB-dependent receptor plug domain-containing protein n=2 Tax=Mucilaginibacter gynuensis TaxID=1302236 RepID=A0ABP8FVM9_9SPHI
MLFFCSSDTFAQTSDRAIVQDIITKMTCYVDSSAQEKVYLHTDKPYYTLNDTLYFKSYLFNATYLTASAKSGILYVEIANEQNRIVKRAMVALYVGLGWGNIVLTDKIFQNGNYTLRAYTNWMRNNGTNGMFEKQFYISSPGEGDVLIKSRFSAKLEDGKQKASIGLKVNKLDERPLILEDFILRVTDGKKVWYKDKVRTMMDGAIDYGFNIPEKAAANKLFVSLQPANKAQSNTLYSMPLLLNRPENIDLQFMPEGGSLVAGINTRVAFKALSEDGLGTNVSGIIYNSKQQEAGNFQSLHAGIGSFGFVPQVGEVYTAKIKLPDGTYSKPYPLPVVKPSGTVLNVINKLGADSLEINVSATLDIPAANYYLIGQSRGIGCYAVIMKIIHGSGKVKVDRAQFSTGIARFSLLNTAKQVLNERIIYIDQADDLRITMVPDKKRYDKRDSVAMNMIVTNKAGEPVQGSFSIAVTDDTQVKTDSLKTNNLKSYALLTSELKGQVEDPGYYFPPAYNPEKWQQLDNLLLAQGWVNYDWASVFQPFKQPSFTAEANFTIKGKVTNMFNKPVKSSGVLLLSKKPGFILDTVTNNNGVFTFDNLVPSDTASYLIQARNRKGKSFNVGVEVDEFVAPVFTTAQNRTMPWYVNTDTTSMVLVKNKLTYDKKQQELSSPNMLKQVNIKNKRIIKGSKNLNEDGGSDLVLDEEYLQGVGKLTLGDLLEKNIKGFRQGNGKNPYMYFVFTQQMHLIIDGIDIDFGAPDPIGSFPYSLYVKQFLDYYNAEDIKGIELMKSTKYNMTYMSRYVSNPMALPWDHAFIEVTTYSGSGPYLSKTPGVYIYKPMAFYPAKEFYSPKYKSKDDKSFIDTRSTIYWAPNIITGKDGKATVSFYTADISGTYHLSINGSDMEGNIGSNTTTIKVQ